MVINLDVVVIGLHIVSVCVAVCSPYSISPRLQSSLSTQSTVFGVTRCDNKLFVVCYMSDTISVFGANNEQLDNIEVKGLKYVRDIVADCESRQLYIADYSNNNCVWRVSLEGHVDKWLTNKSTTATQFSPYTLSVTSRRLLVTSSSRETDELLLFGADGVELNRVSPPDMKGLEHAVETLHGTFIVCHWRPQRRVVEVDVAGHVTRVYSDQQQLTSPVYLALDSDSGVFVADIDRHRVLLLNSRLELERILLDSEQHQLMTSPWRLCYTEHTRQLCVGCWSNKCVQVFSVGD